MRSDGQNGSAAGRQGRLTSAGQTDIVRGPAATPEILASGRWKGTLEILVSGKWKGTSEAEAS